MGWYENVIFHIHYPVQHNYNSQYYSSNHQNIHTTFKYKTKTALKYAGINLTLDLTSKQVFLL